MKLTLGPKIAEGREAEVYAWDDGAVLKLYRPGYLGHVAEAAALARLENSGVAPRLLGSVELDGRHGLALERLDGTDMLAMLERTPWRMLGLARIFGETHVLVNCVQAAPELLDIRATLAVRVIEGVTAPGLRDFVLRVLDQLPAGDRLCHGDLHPGNVLVADGSARVIDWANATRGVPTADYARTMLLVRHAAPLPGTSALMRGLLSVGRGGFARAYSATYRRRSSHPLRDVRQWTVVHAASRLAEGIETEERKLLDFLEGEQRRAIL